MFSPVPAGAFHCWGISPTGTVRAWWGLWAGGPHSGTVFNFKKYTSWKLQKSKSAGND